MKVPDPDLHEQDDDATGMSERKILLLLLLFVMCVLASAGYALWGFFTEPDLNTFWAGQSAVTRALMLAPLAIYLVGLPVSLIVQTQGDMAVATLSLSLWTLGAVIYFGMRLIGSADLVTFWAQASVHWVLAVPILLIGATTAASAIAGLGYLLTTLFRSGADSA